MEDTADGRRRNAAPRSKRGQGGRGDAMAVLANFSDSLRSFHIRRIFAEFGLMFVTGSELPIVVVLSGSMEPGFKRGDVLFLHMGQDPIRIGEIVVFTVDGRDIPIVHRVVKVLLSEVLSPVCKHVFNLDWSNFYYQIFIGDGNNEDDRILYAHDQLWLHQHQIKGRAVGFFPYAGWFTTILSDNRILKYLLFGFLGLMTLAYKE